MTFHRPHARHGFTLIEVMIVVALVAILSSIAIPAYREYVIRGNIPEATSRLATMQVRMEQFFQDNRTYVGGPACIVDNTSNKRFNFSCTAAATATTYTAQAVGKGAMANFAFTVDQAGNRRTTSVPSGWILPNPNNCWVTKKDGSC